MSTPASPRPRSRLRRATLALALLTAAAGCQRAQEGKENKPPTTGTAAGTAAGTGAGTGTGTAAEAPIVDLDSKDILSRTELAASADIKHVLIGWKGMGRSQSDRSNAEAAKLAKEVADQLRKDPSKVDELMKAHSEDPGSAKSGRVYTVTPDASLVPEFKQLGLRLKLDEVGIVKTDFGYHVMLRVAPPPPDPLQSADILARPAETGTVHVQHVMIGWKDTPAAAAGMGDPRAQARSKADADKLASEVLAKARKGGDFAALMKEHSEDPQSKDDGRAYPVAPGRGPIPGFTDLALRLKEGEVGLVKTDAGWHVMKRVPPPPPPPPDKLDSTAILSRQPVTDKAKVKHILLGWKEVNAGNDKAMARSRADLEKLVKKTMADLKKGAKIEPLMKELSEDPGSAASGEGYDVTPDAGLVEPFKNLSLRLNVGEVGAVKTQFGIHIIQRVE